MTRILSDFLPSVTEERTGQEEESKNKGKVSKEEERRGKERRGEGRRTN